MKNIQMLKVFFNLVLLIIFFVQSKQSLNKYFDYPVVIQESSVSIDMIKKPDIQVSIGDQP